MLLWGISHSHQVNSFSNSIFFHLKLFSGMELKDNILVSGNADSTVKIWDILTGQCLQTLSGKVGVSWWLSDNNGNPTLVPGPNKHQSAVTCLQFNNKFVVTSSDDGTVKLWDVKTGGWWSHCYVPD